VYNENMPQLFFPHAPWAIGVEVAGLTWVALRYGSRIGSALDFLGFGSDFMAALALGGGYAAYNQFIVPA
jgi:hypothetical protein